MAGLSIYDISTHSAKGYIYSLGNVFSSDFYKSAGIAHSQCSSGQATEPSGRCDIEIAPSSNTKNRTPEMSISGLDDDTPYTLYGWARAANGFYYPAGWNSFMTLPDIPPPPNPPFNVTSTPSTNSIKFNWSNGSVYTRTHWVIERVDDPGNGVYDSESGSITNVTIYGLVPSTAYKMMIWGESGGGTSAVTNHFEWTSNSNTRPVPFTVFTSLVSGATYPVSDNSPNPVTANEWNLFQDHLDDLSTYMRVSAHGYGNVTQGFPIRERFNNIRYYIKYTLQAPIDPPEMVFASTVIANHFFDLQSSVNSIP